VNGIRYNTESAVKIGSAQDGRLSHKMYFNRPPRDRIEMGYWEMTLYHTKKSGRNGTFQTKGPLKDRRFFLHGRSGPLRRFAQGAGRNAWMNGEDIIPITRRAAWMWMSRYSNPKARYAVFGKWTPREDDEVEELRERVAALKSKVSSEFMHGRKPKVEAPFKEIYLAHRPPRKTCKVINGFPYDIRTAMKICDLGKYNKDGAFFIDAPPDSIEDWFFERSALYATRKEAPNAIKQNPLHVQDLAQLRFFIYGYGGPMTRFAQGAGRNEWMNGEDIIRITTIAAVSIMYSIDWTGKDRHIAAIIDHLNMSPKYEQDELRTWAYRQKKVPVSERTGLTKWVRPLTPYERYLKGEQAFDAEEKAQKAREDTEGQ